MDIPEVTDLDRAFGSIEHLPKWEDIPEEFKDHKNKWNSLAAHLFYKGSHKVNFKLKDPLKPEAFKKIVRVLGAILTSFDPRHEHKMAGVGYLLSQWFEDWSENGSTETEVAGAETSQQV